MKFKVGDKVVHKPSGRTVTIWGTSGTSNYYLEGDGFSSCRLYHESILKKASEEKPLKFKVGDKVRLVENFSGLIKGHTGVISYAKLSQNDPKGYYKVFFNGVEIPYGVFGRRMELVVEKEEMEYELNKWYMYNGDLSTKPEVKEGDKIQVFMISPGGSSYTTTSPKKGPWDWSDDNTKNIVSFRFTKFAEEAKEMTVAEIEKALGYSVKVVK